MSRGAVEIKVDPTFSVQFELLGRKSEFNSQLVSKSQEGSRGVTGTLSRTISLWNWCAF